MITTENLTVKFGSEPLFENVNIKFSSGNCYGLIGANGAGKSTFLKVLSGELEPTAGAVHIKKGQRIAVLKQNIDIHNILMESGKKQQAIIGWRQVGVVFQFQFVAD